MSLSEQEQRLLEEMERSLYQNDADVVSTSGGEGLRISPRSIAIAVLAVAVGIVLILGGLVLSQTWLGLIGFVVMVGGVYWAFTSGRSGERQDDKNTPSGSSSRQSKSARASRADSGFMHRMEQRWDRRRDE